MDQLKAWGFFSLLVLTSAERFIWSGPELPSPDPESYLIVTPKYFRPGGSILILFTALGDSDVMVEATLEHKEVTLASTSAEVRRGLTESLILSPMALEDFLVKPGIQVPFTLKVKGRVGRNVVLSEETELYLKPKGLSTFIQTDKSNYLPGQKVKIRAVSIHPDGKPYQSPVDIIIKDPRGNRIRQWLALDSVLGVVSKEFQLSDNPPLGHWNVCTSVNGVLTEKQFNVAHYVLPKFEVVIEAPSAIYHDNIYGSVTAKHLYGKPVKGHMVIKFTHHIRGMAMHYREEKEIDGTTDFMFNVSDPDYFQPRMRPEFEEYYDDYHDDYFMEESITIAAYVTEDQTELTYNSTATVAVAEHRFELSFTDYSKILKPSLSFTAKLKISTYNDMPLSLEDQEKTVMVSVMEQNSDRRWVTLQRMDFLVPADGVILLNIGTTNETRALSIDASVEDSQKTLRVSRGRKSSTTSFLQIQKLSSAQIGSPITLNIDTTFRPNKFYFIVMSRGEIVAHGQTFLSSINLQTNEDWAPLACIVVYCIHPDGEIISDTLRLPMTHILKNEVSLSWNGTMKKPGERLSLMVSVEEPRSLVGILVVDKATRSKYSRNDITEDMVLKEMLKYGDPNGDMMGKQNSMFEVCCLVVLTDVKLPMTDSYYDHFPSLYDEEVPHMEHHQEPRERRNFPETWLWMDYHTGDLTTAELTVTVPDSIATWVATAFVMSERLGLGIMQMPAELTVFQDFFLSLHLPAFIIRGEELILEIFMFNYLPHAVEVIVIIAESDSFEFIFPDNEDLSIPSARQVSVGSQSSASVLIPIKTLVLGEIPISVTAISVLATDAIRRTILVKPEGLEQTFSQTLFLEISPSGSSIHSQMSFTFPAHVEGSKRVEVTAVGDILGPSIKGLNSLIRMPYGCGEQNMINFAPNIYVLQYLNATGQANHETTEKATSYMISGYELELSYQRQDGSFSAFGDSDISGSTWLSAFVLRCFLQARSFISIDVTVLDKVAAWIGQQQGADGRFDEPGRVIHTELQGGLDSPVSLTAYVLMALLEDEDIRIRYNSEVSAALGFLETKLALGIESNYSLSLLTYALALAGSSTANSALTELMGRAEMRDGVPMWTSSDAGLSASWQPRSADIEMVSYVLLSMHKLQIVVQGLSLMKWLSQQRNHLGGFGSTQDTVMGLQALSAYASLSGSHDLDLIIRVNTDPATTVATFYIDETNYLLHQTKEIDPQDELSLSITAEGKGFALFQLHVFYNIESGQLQRRKRDADEHEAFDLDIKMDDSGMNSAHLFICTRLSEDLDLEATGMVVMEVSLLSGFSLAPVGVETNNVIKKVESEQGKVILYIDSVTKEKICVGIPLILEHKVAKVQDGIVLIYDYYEPRRKTVKTYASEQRKGMSSCSFCGEDCNQCRPGEKPVTAGATQTSLGPLRTSLLFILLLPLLI